MKDWVKNNKPTIIMFLLVIGFIAQGYFMYLTTTHGRARNLLIIEKAPVRLIARWDDVENEEKSKDVIKLEINERMKWYDTIIRVPFQDYKFNENIYIRINTLDLKSDKADIKLDEKSNITEKEN